MLAIGLAIGDVVDQIHAAGQRAEDAEGFDRCEDRLAIEQAFGEDQPGEDQEVLGPLAGAEGEEEVEGDRTHGAARYRGGTLYRRIGNRQISMGAARHLARGDG